MCVCDLNRSSFGAVGKDRPESPLVPAEALIFSEPLHDARWPELEYFLLYWRDRSLGGCLEALCVLMQTGGRGIPRIQRVPHIGIGRDFLNSSSQCGYAVHHSRKLVPARHRSPSETPYGCRLAVGQADIHLPSSVAGIDLSEVPDPGHSLS